MMPEDVRTLQIAEVPYESGEVHFRYARYLAPDGTRWIRDGLFCEYYLDGTLASEGTYKDGREQGLWRDYHENGVLAAEGQYVDGEEVGEWKYWNSDGSPQVK